MAKYVDGFVLTVPKKNMAQYRKMAMQASKIFLKHGALEYKECVGDDMNIDWALPFPKLTKAKSDEVIVFSWITYKSRAARDRANKAMMNDPKMKEMSPEKMPFNMKRMAYGGFKTIVDK
ncbi:DUF1428 domain-containing protein [Bdellovibrio bacteriovorus]|uniref:DUF1428 domain-containing protein n=1 Tax=Bdellovibrio bacteriovorus TaxID=959 RepID=UPI003AA87DBC